MRIGLSDCGHQIKLVWSSRDMDVLLPDGSIQPGELREVWQVCGKRRGHRGVHGPGSRIRRIARRLFT